MPGSYDGAVVRGIAHANPCPTAAVRLLVTGGCGFVGASVSAALAARNPDWEVVAFDNLRRRGSELNLPRLRLAGVEFVHGDVRDPGDLLGVGHIDALVECSAEPAVLAGYDSPDYVVSTNLFGAYHCLELARRDDALYLFLSTSRVYPTDTLRGLDLIETDTRFELAPAQTVAGASPAGISEAFPLDGARTLYGTTKLAGELLAVEYADAFGLRTVTNRCGVIAGPWQMGKVDQGVFTHWVLSHYFERPLRYIGYGATGKQVRDLLHIDDLVDLIEDQLLRPEHWSGFNGNVGGGRECSLSLLETTNLCRELTGNEVPIEPVDQERPGDVPLFISDCGRLFERTDWRPRSSPRDVLEEIAAWVDENHRTLETALL
jgi:CDP-paratose 2-epimerase